MTLEDRFNSALKKSLNDGQHHHVPILGSLPLDPKLTQQSDIGVPLVISHPESLISLSMINIASKIIETLRLS